MTRHELMVRASALAWLTLWTFLLLVGIVLFFAHAERPTPPPWVLDRQQAESLNYWWAPLCTLDAHAGDDLREIRRRMERCTGRLEPLVRP